MPKGSSPTGHRATETMARETITGLFLEVLDLTKSADPRAWEQAAFKLDEAADAARFAEVLLDGRGTATAASEAQDGLATLIRKRVMTREEYLAQDARENGKPDFISLGATFVPAPRPEHGAALAAIVSGLTGRRR